MSELRKHTMRRFLFTGDSITRGEIGRSYIPRIRNRFPESELVNLGQNGDTLTGIARRTLEHLRTNTGFSVIAVAAGHNDIILPALAGISRFHRSIPRNLARKGSVVADGLENFIDTYRGFIHELRKTSDAAIILSTMSSLNEDPESPTAQIRRRYNDAIRDLTREEGVTLADVGAAFDNELSADSPRDYFLDNLAAMVSTDRWNSRSPASAGKLSSRRGLSLTIDGVHINEHGAELYARCFSDAIAGILKDTH